jgi:hypothetical protein
MFGDMLRRITSQKASEKSNDLAQAQRNSPDQWVTENIDDLKRLMMEKAQLGSNTCELGLEYNLIENKVVQYKSIKVGDAILDSPYHKDFSKLVYKALSKVLSVDGIVILRTQKEVRHKGRLYHHEQWTLKW